MKAQIVSFHCVLSDPMGKVISSTFNQDVITIDGQSEFLKGLTQGLQNLKKGEKRRICVAAEQAYGLYNPDLVLEVPRDRLGLKHALACGHQLKQFLRSENAKCFE